MKLLSFKFSTTLLILACLSWVGCIHTRPEAAAPSKAPLRTVDHYAFASTEQTNLETEQLLTITTNPESMRVNIAPPDAISKEEAEDLFHELYAKHQIKLEAQVDVLQSRGDVLEFKEKEISWWLSLIGAFMVILLLLLLILGIVVILKFTQRNKDQKETFNELKNLLNQEADKQIKTLSSIQTSAISEQKELKQLKQATETTNQQLEKLLQEVKGDLHALSDLRKQANLDQQKLEQLHLKVEANLAYKNEAYEEAARLFEQLMQDESQQQDAMLWFKWGYSLQDVAEAQSDQYQQEQLLEQARQKYEKTLTLDSKHFLSHQNLGIIYMTLTNHSKAIEHFETLIQIKPDYYTALSNLAVCLMEVGGFDEAQKHLKNALHINPDYELAHYNLACLKGRTQNAHECVEHLQSWQALNPFSATQQKLNADADFDNVRSAKAFQDFLKTLPKY